MPTKDFDPDEYLAQAATGFDPDAYLAEAGGEGANYTKTLNEMHPDFTAVDRYMVKNYGNDIDASIAYLQNKHPDMEISQDSGEIVGRKRGEKDYKKLDPDGLWNTLSSPSELLMDVGDISTDVLSGIATGAVTGATALSGNLPAAAAAGAGTAAGLEWLRQGIGKYLAGTNKEISGTDIALSGAFGAASPLLFGSGTTMAQAGKKSLQEGGKRTAEEIFDASRGLLSRAAPKIGELVSGVPKEAIKTAQKDLKGVTSLADDGMLDYTTQLRARIEDALEAHKTSVGNAMNASLDGSTSPVALNPAKAIFDAKIAKAQEQFAKTPTEMFQSKLDALIETRNAIFPEGDVADARSAWEIMQSLKEIGDVAKTPSTSLASKFSATKSLSDKQLANTSTSAYKALQEQIDLALSADGLPGLKSSGLNKQYQEVAKDKKFLSKLFKDDEAIFTKLTGLGAAKKKPVVERLARIDKKYGTNIIEESNKLTANAYFAKPQWMSLPLGGSTSTSRSIPLSVAGAGLGYYLGANSGLGQGGAGIGVGLGGAAGAILGGPKALKFYMQRANNAKFLEDQARRLTGGRVPVIRSGIQSGWNAITKGGEE